MKQEFDPEHWQNLVDDAARAFLTDTSYAIAIAKRSALLTYNRRAKAEELNNKI